MNKASLCVVVTVCGVALIIASLIWPKIAAARGDFGEEQAAEYTTAAQDFHRLSYGPHHDERAGHATTVEKVDADQLAAAKERFEAAQKTKERAQHRRSDPQAWLKWSGIATTLCGAAGYLALRGQSSSG